MSQSIKPTPEQDAIVDAALGGSNLKVKAYAGAAKTSTLGLVANAMPVSEAAYLHLTGKSQSMPVVVFRNTSSRGHGIHMHTPPFPPV